MYAGTSLDQIYAQKFGQDTPIPSMQLCIENVDQAGGCSYGYSCAYTDTISWASPTEPLPMIRDPRVVFDQLFGVGATPSERARRAAATTSSILDWVTESVSELKTTLGAADRARLADYLDDVREIERRIQKVEASTPAASRASCRGAPIGVPDSFEEHVKLMFDLQAVAFAVGHHARLRLQAEPRRLEPRLSRRAARRPRSTPPRITASARTASSTSRRSTPTTSAWCRTCSRS